MSGSVAALPKTGDETTWTATEAALVEAAGLVTGPPAARRLAPRPVVEAFLMHAQRTGLDPIARQIYCIERGGKWGTQVSIDGARLVAERTGKYRGQTPAQWTADGVTWVDVWLAKEPPKAARIGVYRDGFVEPLVAVSTWDQYAQPNQAMWKKMPALMLSKTAEMLALRKAFPQDLSGLYSTEEMDQAQSRPQTQQAPVVQEQPALVEQPVEPSADWFAEAAAVSSKDEANALWRRVPKAERSDELKAALAARLTALAEAEKPSEPEPDPQWAEQRPEASTTDWAVQEIPQPDEAVETVDGVLEGTEVDQAAPSSGYDR